MSARLRFKGVLLDSEIPTPPAGKCSVFYNDTEQVMKAKFDDGSIALLTLSQEYIEDLVANLFQDSSTIDVVYNDAGNVVTLNVIQTALDISLIPNVPSGNLTAVTVQAALNELQSDIDTRATSAALTTHINDISDAHDASAISVVPAGNLLSTDVQAGLTELQGDIDTINTNAVEVAQDAVAAAIAAGTQDGISISYNDPANSLSFTNLDKGSSAISTHVAALDPHIQYLLVNGTRAMSGNLDMGANNITNVNLVDGVDISAHASRHLPSGADPLTTGAPSTIGTTNATGTANAFARQDHIHNHGNQTDPNQHALVTTTDAGFMSAADKTKLDGISGTRIFKAGQIAGATFVGAPRTATVTFGTAMPSTNYSISIMGANSRSWSYQTKTVNGFVINSNANGALSGEVSWIAIDNGETVE